jgi:hypothetical protein
MRAVEGVGRRVIRRPLRDHAVEGGARLGREVWLARRERGLLDMHGVELPVVPEVRVEGDEAEALAEPPL